MPTAREILEKEIFDVLKKNIDKFKNLLKPQQYILSKEISSDLFIGNSLIDEKTGELRLFRIIIKDETIANRLIEIKLAEDSQKYPELAGAIKENINNLRSYCLNENREMPTTEWKWLGIWFLAWIGGYVEQNHGTSIGKAFAHLICAETAFQRAENTAYSQYEEVYKHGKHDGFLKLMSLLGTINLLTKDAYPCLNDQGNLLSPTERVDQLVENTRILKENYPTIINNYFLTLVEAASKTLSILQENSNTLSEQEEIVIKKFIGLNLQYFCCHITESNRDNSAVDNNNSNAEQVLGKACELAITCLQGICILKVEKDQKAYLKARKKFEYCGRILGEIKERREMDEIKGIIRAIIKTFFQKCIELEIFKDFIEDIQLKLNLKDELPPLLEEVKKLIQINFPQFNLIDDPKKIFSLLYCFLVSSEEFVKKKFLGNRSFFHVLAELSPHLDGKHLEQLHRASKQLRHFGLSAYERSIDGKTPYCLIRNEDPHKLKQAFIPENIDFDFIGADKQVTVIRNFFKEEKRVRNFLLLSGPPGTGKTTLAEKIAKESGFDFDCFDRGAESDRWVGQLQERLGKFFKKRDKPTCLFIDEIDAIVPAEIQLVQTYEQERIAVIQMGITSLTGSNTVLLSATNYLSNIKSAIRDRAQVVHFSLPTINERRMLIEYELREHVLADNCIVKQLAEATSGWSPRRIKNYLDKVTKATGNKNSFLASKIFSDLFEDECQALREDYPNLIPPKLKLKPSSEIFEGLVGLDNAVKTELSSLTLLLNNPEPYRLRNIAQKHILLYGPPGTGKTAFARAIANHSNAMFIYIDAGSYKLPGSEKLLKRNFELARSFEKAIIFIDEIDALATEYSPARHELQTQMEGFSKQQSILIVIGATNRLEAIAEPIQSRFSSPIEVPLPVESNRAQLFQHYISSQPNKPIYSPELTEGLSATCEEFARLSKGYSARDIYNSVKLAMQKYTDEEQDPSINIKPTTFSAAYIKFFSSSESGNKDNKRKNEGSSGNDQAQKQQRLGAPSPQNG